MVFAAICSAVFVLRAAPLDAASVTFTDTIDAANQTNFNGFEGISTTFVAGETYVEDNILVTQINGDPNGIVTVLDPGGKEGLRAWYPNGGDLGYTRITLEDNTDFTDVGMLVGSGSSQHDTLLFGLFLDGSEVLTGSIAHSASLSYLGFIGGGFDEILLRDTGLSTASLFDGTANMLVLDSIEIVAFGAGIETIITPIPPALPLFLSGLVGLGIVARRRRKTSRDA